MIQVTRLNQTHLLYYSFGFVYICIHINKCMCVYNVSQATLLPTWSQTYLSQYNFIYLIYKVFLYLLFIHFYKYMEIWTYKSFSRFYLCGKKCPFLKWSHLQKGHYTAYWNWQCLPHILSEYFDTGLNDSEPCYVATAVAHCMWFNSYFQDLQVSRD